MLPEPCPPRSRARFNRAWIPLVVIALLAPTLLAQGEQETEQPKAPKINFQVLKRRTVDLGDRFITLNRVVPPVLPEPPPSPQPRPATAEEIAAWEAEEARQPRKKYEILFLSATVFDRKVTEIRWWTDKREHRIFSNIDFNLLAGAGDFETEDAVYSLMLGLGNETSEQVEGFNEYAAAQGWPKRYWREIPSPDTFSKTRAEYVIVENERHIGPSEEELKALDALHLFFDTNKQRLTEEYVKREADNAERARWLKEHPPVPQDVVVNYWRKPSELPKARGNK